jgi:hypothetical protein
MNGSSDPSASWTGDLISPGEARLRRVEQDVIDAEVRASRRGVLAAFRHRLRTDPETLVADDFLAVADRPALDTAIIIAAGGVADSCDLQLADPHTGALRIVRQRGFAPSFLDYFASVDATVPSACGTALATGDPVLIDDITASPIFAGQPTLPVMLAAGTRSVHSYPLHDKSGDLLGMLSLHYGTPGRHQGQERLAWAAAQAMARLGALPASGCRHGGSVPRNPSAEMR